MVRGASGVATFDLWDGDRRIHGAAPQNEYAPPVRGRGFLGRDFKPILPRLRRLGPYLNGQARAMRR